MSTDTRPYSPADSARETVAYLREVAARDANPEARLADSAAWFRDVVARMPHVEQFTRDAAVIVAADLAGCTDCGVPVELADPDDLDSWIHADGQPADGHSAWVTR